MPLISTDIIRYRCFDIRIFFYDISTTCSIKSGLRRFVLWIKMYIARRNTKNCTNFVHQFSIIIFADEIKRTSFLVDVAIRKQISQKPSKFFIQLKRSFTSA